MLNTGFLERICGQSMKERPSPEGENVIKGAQADQHDRKAGC
jgi:hypothetical protein